MTSGTALITGVGGQDGVLLARHLLGLGYRVVGTSRPSSTQPGSNLRLGVYLDGVTIAALDPGDRAGFAALIEQHRPDEVYNLAAQSSVARGWDDPQATQATNAGSVEHMLATLASVAEPPRFFQASSSEIFGTTPPNPQNEQAPLHPDNPYAESKARAHAAVAAARDDGLFACSGILYNHESPVRDPHFVVRKITRAAAEIAAGQRDVVELGNLDVSRDWGAATDYVVAMHAALTHDEPGDYVIATGESHTLRELVEAAFASAGVADGWSHVRQDPELLRRSDPPGRVGDITRARDVLGWQPTTSFADLVASMVDVDRRRVDSGIEESPDYLS